MMTPKEFKEWCMEKHDYECNQQYDGNIQYSKHLEFVVAHCNRFKHLIEGWVDFSPYSASVVATMGCWGHDLIEDARVTYNDLVAQVGETVADVIYCCTEEKGRDRDERHSIKYYTELSFNKIAVFVKLCDIMANVTYSLLTNSKMYEKHKKEHEKTLKYLYRIELNEMFQYLDKLFNICS